MDLVREGRWRRCEDLLWGSLTLAVKGVALSRGDEPDGRQAVERYAVMLGNECRDRRIRDAFSKLASFPDAVDRVSESRSRVNHLVTVLEDVTGAVERLWELLPGVEEPEEFVDEDDGPQGIGGSSRREL